MNTSSILMRVIKYLSEGYDVEYIEGKLGIDDDGVIIGIINQLRESNYKEDISKGRESLELTRVLNLYINGFTYEELGILTKYSKEGIRNKLKVEMIKEGRSVEECKSKNKEMRKSMRDSLFYEEYLRDLDVEELEEVINRSPYSKSTFLKRMKDLR